MAPDHALPHVEPAPGRHVYEYARPALTVDIAVLCRFPDGDRLLLIRRASPPYAGMRSLPGGFVDVDETPEAAARREASEEVGLDLGALSLIGVYGTPGRDPRGWTVSVAYAARVSRAQAEGAQAGDDAVRGDLLWCPVESLPALAFDHARIATDVLAAGLG